MCCVDEEKLESRVGLGWGVIYGSFVPGAGAGAAWREKRGACSRGTGAIGQ
jgi:hypothetical protein